MAQRKRRPRERTEISDVVRASKSGLHGREFSLPARAGRRGATPGCVDGVVQCSVFLTGRLRRVRNLSRNGDACFPSRSAVVSVQVDVCTTFT